MHKEFDATAIERKWQQRWQREGMYRTDSNSQREKCYVLDMFPYPSGEGLHVGHPKGYIATDIYSRYKRMNGFEVLHPMGWDAFGLPAENFAIKHKVHPSSAVEKNIARFKEQLGILGFDYDWDREINTTDPQYYKWTQWIFIQLYKRGLAYQSNEPINWCSGCQTGLANEDLEPDGTCERCGSEVVKKPMRQWVLRIREYADRMLEDLDTLSWPEHIKEAQRQWIGRSEGAEIDFVLSSGATVSVFTTRPDTLCGATYLVLAPEHPLVSELTAYIENNDQVQGYVEEAAKLSEQDRLNQQKEKTGVCLEGVTAINPVTREHIPVYVADYVLAHYGTGAIMAVPAHDERDFAFAKKFGLPIKTVVTERTVTHAAALLESKQQPGTFIFQQRDDGAPILPNKIALFGGEIETDETIRDALARELQEELELSLSDRKISESYSFPSEVNEHFQVWAGYIKDVDENKLTCHEGSIVTMTAQEAVEHSEVSDSTKMLLKRFLSVAEPYVGHGQLVESGLFDGMYSKEAKSAIVDSVGAKLTQTYKLKDWVFSRQRYWGEPIPLVHTEDGQVYPISPAQLPVLLPEVESYAPTGTGESPLAAIDEWVNVTGYIDDENDFVVASSAPPGKQLITAKRESNTMPQWAGSSWYYLRFIDPHNDDVLVSPELEKHWGPVDVYVGGDHAVRHLIYARFWHKFLYDIGVVHSIEPFQRLEFLGFILAEDGRKMSKRWGNIISPDEIVALVGADTMRVYEMFMGPFENTIAWSKDGLVGARRFLERVNGLDAHITDKEPDEIAVQMHKTIAKIRHDIEHFKFNTAISAMMIFVNQAEKHGLTKSSYLTFLRLLAPFAPHLTDELWFLHSDSDQSIHKQSFPVPDERKMKETSVTIGVQVNGKVRGSITISPDLAETEAVDVALQQEDIVRHVGEGQIRKIIYKPGKILNLIVVNNK